MIHRAYGLVVRSPLALWPAEHAEPEHTPHDVEVAITDGPQAPDSGFSLASRDTATYVPGVGSLRVADGRRIEVTPEPDVDRQLIATTISGAGLAMILHQRGAFTLHASSVAIGAVAIAIAGASGAGKSTLATALYRRGHHLISDGMTALELRDDGSVVALVGPRTAKLWPDAANHLGFRAESLPRALPLQEKRLCTLDDAAPVRAVPLACVLSTSVGEPPHIEPLGASAGVMELVKNAFLVDWLDAASSPALLELCARIAARVEIAALARGATLDDLTQVSELIVRRCAGAAARRR